MKRFKLLAAYLTLFAMYGCGSGDSSIEQHLQVTPPSKGIFTDSPVAGVSYKTASLNGITDTNGEFQYYPGETVTFSIGDVILGSSPASSKITPIDLGSSFNDTNPRTINIARLLQSLDHDGNHDNGILITPETRAEMAGKSIDFAKNVADFNDADMQALFASLNSKGVFCDGVQRSLASDLTAQYNLRHSLNPSVKPFDGIWSVYYQYPSNTGSSGVTLSIGGYEIDPPPALPNTGHATVTISDSMVTFEPVYGASVTGTISTSGIIKIPDRTINCKNISSDKLVLSSKLILNSDGSINGEWQIGLPSPAIGYCFPYWIKTAFIASQRLTGNIQIPSISISLDNP